MQGLNWLSATQAAQGIRDGVFSSVDLVNACLAQIDAKEPQVQAWAYLDRDYALAQAKKADEWRAQGHALGPLHGVPVGIKDIIDTRDMPTEDGTPLHAGRRPWYDAKVVDLLRAAGAVILGKTVTTEMATYHPGKTCNPHNPAHTPGGSSSGSAAAVAAGMVPLTVGTQTNGSMIRPASFCGVHGFKPTRGTVSCRGILVQSELLDQPGFFARDVQDLALMAEVLAVYDPDQENMRPHAPVPFVRIAGDEPPMPPKLALVKTPWWDDVDAEVQEGFDELAQVLGREQMQEFPLPPSAVQALTWHQTLMEAGIASHFADEYDRGREQMSDSLRQQIERGRDVRAVDYLASAARIPQITEALDDVFDQYDVIITPASASSAPLGLSSTGSPLFCTLWTYCGMPAISVPLLSTSNGMPVGVQLVGRVGDDARLLRTANWLMSVVQGI